MWTALDIYVLGMFQGERGEDALATMYAVGWITMFKWGKLAQAEAPEVIH